MAQTSKRATTLRRAKRRATLAERQTKAVLTGSQQAFMVITEEMNRLKALLFALLAQAGGTLPVTVGTQKQVIDAFPRLSVTSAYKDGDETTLLVTLVEAPEVPEEKPAPKLTIRGIADDEAEYAAYECGCGEENCDACNPDETETTNEGAN